MKTNLPTKRLLITGIPGTGKTNFGNYLAAEYEYIHIDMESGDYISAIMINPTSFIEDLVKKQNNIVITWGFVPSDELIQVVNMFRNYIFKIIWFDGDRATARRKFIERNQRNGSEYLKSSLTDLDLQMSRIENSKVINGISPIIVNTFKVDHTFKDLDQILNEIENA